MGGIVFFFFLFQVRASFFPDRDHDLVFRNFGKKKKKKKKKCSHTIAAVLLNIFSDESPPRFARIAIRQLRYFSGKNKKKKSGVRTGVALRAYRLP